MLSQCYWNLPPVKELVKDFPHSVAKYKGKEVIVLQPPYVFWYEHNFATHTTTMQIKERVKKPLTPLHEQHFREELYGEEANIDHKTW